MSKKTWQLISVLLDIFFINVAIVLAFVFRFQGSIPEFNFQAYTNLAVFITIIQIGALFIYDIYLPERTEGAASIFGSVVKAATLGTLATVSLTFFVGFFTYPRSVFLISWLFLIVFLTGWRLVSARVLLIDWPTQRILVVGTGELGRQVIKELRARKKWGYEIIGVVKSKVDQVKEIDDIPVVGLASNLIDIIQEQKADRVIVTAPIKQRELLEELPRTHSAGVKIEIVPDLYEIFIGTVDHNLLSDIPLIELTKEPVPGWESLAKSLMDRIGGVVLLIITTPLLLFVAVIVKFTSHGPVIFAQKRVGRREKVFNQYKFRTMIADAEVKTGPVLAKEDDKRITRVGSYLRRFRLDELPQLVNILEGHMSFVGPRPERPFFVDQFKKEIPGYVERFRIKPGLTGLAQVNGSYATTAANKLKYDLIYIYHQSFFLDLKILFNTVKVVLTASGSR